MDVVMKLLNAPLPVYAAIKTSTNPHYSNNLSTKITITAIYYNYGDDYKKHTYYKQLCKLKKISDTTIITDKQTLLRLSFYSD